jgi:ribosomal protein S18 acetylase RimI-like enzyme
MTVTIRRDCSGVDWQTVAAILKRVGMAHYEPALHKKAFEASHTAVFVYQDGRLIGFGRAISDDAYQAAVYDCAVLPEFQGRGVGRQIMDAILARLAHCNVVLYASPGKEGFYRKLGFRTMKTGMARFIKSAAMRERGFTD